MVGAERLRRCGLVVDVQLLLHLALGVVALGPEVLRRGRGALVAVRGGRLVAVLLAVGAGFILILPVLLGRALVGDRLAAQLALLPALPPPLPLLLPLGLLGTEAVLAALARQVRAASNPVDHLQGQMGGAGGCHRSGRPRVPLRHPLVLVVHHDRPRRPLARAPAARTADLGVVARVDDVVIHDALLLDDAAMDGAGRVRVAVADDVGRLSAADTVELVVRLLLVEHHAVSGGRLLGRSRRLSRSLRLRTRLPAANLAWRQLAKDDGLLRVRRRHQVVPDTLRRRRSRVPPRLRAAARVHDLATRQRRQGLLLRRRV
mmetsp:Transcript_16828/g.58869  ORF Transcript_16828/g.58869 Transcript_16828/m.58869 type:complete len:318 (+) Transcript_16828:224-1177(+)